MKPGPCVKLHREKLVLKFLCFVFVKMKKKKKKKRERGVVAVTVSRKQIDAVLFGYKCTFAINLLFT